MTKKTEPAPHPELERIVVEQGKAVTELQQAVLRMYRQIAAIAAHTGMPVPIYGAPVIGVDLVDAQTAVINANAKAAADAIAAQRHAAVPARTPLDLRAMTPAGPSGPRTPAAPVEFDKVTGLPRAP